MNMRTDRPKVQTVIPLARPLDCWTLVRFEENGKSVDEARTIPIVAMAMTDRGEVEYLMNDDDLRCPRLLTEFEETLTNMVIVGVLPVGQRPYDEEFEECQRSLTDQIRRSERLFAERRAEWARQRAGVTAGG
jgi:hypothetical protein